MTHPTQCLLTACSLEEVLQVPDLCQDNYDRLHTLDCYILSPDVTNITPRYTLWAPYNMAMASLLAYFAARAM